MRQPVFIFVVGVCGVLAACGSSSRTSVNPNPTTDVPPSNLTAPLSPTTTSTTKAAPTGAEVSPSGDIPDNQIFVAYAPSGGPYSIDVPEGWARTTTGGAVTFLDHFNSIRIGTTRRAVARSVTAARTLDVPALQSTETGFVLGTITEVRRRSGPVVLITYRAQSAADAVTGKSVALDIQRYEYWRNGVSVVVTLAAPAGSDNVDPWKRVTDSFAWTR